jgi:fanconi anemia group D2 protein
MQLPIFLYLLRDLHDKLVHLNPSSKPFLSTSQAKYTQAHWHKSMQDLVDKVQTLFLSLRKHLDGAVSMIKDGEHYFLFCSKIFYNV